MERNAAWLALGLLAAAMAGCGDEEQPPRARTIEREPYRGGPQEESFADRRDDVRVVAAAERPPQSDELDLVRVTLRRAGNRLTVSFRTQAPPAPPMTQTLLVFDRRVVSDAGIEVRHRRDGSVRAVARGARGTAQPVGARVSGRTVVVAAPLTELSRQRRFKWRAVTAARGEIVDRLPDRAHDYSFFPP